MIDCWVQWMMVVVVGLMMGLVWWGAAMVSRRGVRLSRTLPETEPGPRAGSLASVNTVRSASSQPQLPGAAQSAVSSQHRDTEQRWHTRGLTLGNTLQYQGSLQWAAADSAVDTNVLCRGVWTESQPWSGGPLMWSNKLVRTSQQPLCARTHVRWAAQSATEQGPDWSTG